MTGKFQLVLCAAFLLLMSAVGLHAQVVNSGVQTISLNATLTDGLTVSLSTNAVTFNLVSGSSTNNGSTGVSATTSWVSKPGNNLSVYAYFNNSASALSDAFGDNIPSADFLLSNNGGAYTPLTGTVAFGGGGAGLRLFNVKITGTNKTGNHTDNMLFRIDLSTLPQLPAGTYTGTLNIQAQII